MAEYIDLEIAKRCFQNFDAGNGGCSTILTPTEFAEYLDDIESADVTPVRHSQWVVRYDGLYECSSCKKEALYKAVRDGFGNAYFEQELSDSCPYCGAKMDGGNCDD